MESQVIYRHSIATRILHWLNAVCVFVVLMSGLQIFNAHPRLYWGEYGANTDTALIQIGISAVGYRAELAGSGRRAAVALLFRVGAGLQQRPVSSHQLRKWARAA
jgi:hypothetical protein